MTLVDTHCHLYLDEFRNDIKAVIDRARLEGVKKFYLPAIDSEVIKDMLALCELYNEECFPMMGLHPCSVKENYMDELTLVEEWLGKRRFAAVGEIGLDFYWDNSFVEQQYHAFKLQMQWALDHDLPIVIHSRNAIRECIDTVKPFAAKGLKGIFHCFGDNLSLAHEIITMGFYLGIGGVITYKKSGLSEVIKHIDLQHIVLETDAPYLTPVPFRGKRNESSYLKYVVEAIASAKGLTKEEVAEITTRNAEQVYRLQ